MPEDGIDTLVLRYLADAPLAPTIDLPRQRGRRGGTLRGLSRPPSAPRFPLSEPPPSGR